MKGGKISSCAAIETVYLILGLKSVYWDSNPVKTLPGTWTHVAATWTGPKPMVFQLRSQTWFQDLMNLRFLISHRTSYSVRDSDRQEVDLFRSERKTLNQEYGPLQKASAVALKSGMVSFYGLGNFIGWMGYYFNYLGEGIEISRNWAIIHFLVFWWLALEPSWSLWVCHLACWLGIKSSWLVCHLGSI